MIEVAAAVMNIAGPENGFDLQRRSGDSEKIATILNWGPQFARQWLDGTILHQWADEQQFSPEERSRWLNMFTQGDLKQFLVKNVSDPMKALKVVVGHVKTTLTDESIATHLGWSEAEVAEIFTPGLRKYTAIGNPTNPLNVLETVAQNLESLTDESIATHLGWSEAEVAEVFTPGLRKHFIVVHHSSDPMKSVETVAQNLETLTDENIAAHLGWSEAEVAEVFTPGLRKHIAVNNISNPFKAVETVAQNLETLTDENIAAHLGWSEAEVAEVFTPTIRKYVAVGYLTDPL